MTTESIKIVQYQEKYKDQVLELHNRETASSIKVKRLQWIVLFFKSNGIILSILYLMSLAYTFDFFFGLFVAQLHILLSSAILSIFTFFIILPLLSRKLAKQATHYSQSIADNDLEDIKSTYQSTTDKNFWVALDEYENVCGCIALQNSMPMETSYHLGKYIKDSEGIRVAEIKRMTVSTNYRRRGIGTKLCQEAITFAKQQNFRAIVLTTITLNQPTIALYKKNGFFRVSSFFFQVLWKIFGIQVEVYLKLL